MKKISRLLISLGALTILSPAAYGKYEIIDQQFVEDPNLPGYTYYGIPSDRDVAQTFTVSKPGLLTRIEASMMPQGKTGNPVVSLYSVANGVPDSALFTTSVPGSSFASFPENVDGFRWLSFDVSPLQLEVRRHDQLAIVITTNGDNWSWSRSHAFITGLSYVRGNYYWRSDEFTGGNWYNADGPDADMEFRTYVLVPEPGAVSLIALSNCWPMLSRVRRN